MQFFNLFVILNLVVKKFIGKRPEYMKKSKFNLKLLLRMNEHKKS